MREKGPKFGGRTQAMLRRQLHQIEACNPGNYTSAGQIRDVECFAAGFRMGACHTLAWASRDYGDGQPIKPTELWTKMIDPKKAQKI